MNIQNRMVAGLVSCLLGQVSHADCDVNAANDSISNNRLNQAGKLLAQCESTAHSSVKLKLAEKFRFGQQPDMYQAAEWYRSVARQGDPEAQYQLGLMYLEGLGVTEDVTAAIALLEKASLQHHVEADELYLHIIDLRIVMDC